MIRGDARRFENWESNVAGKIGLGVAVQHALDIGLQSIQGRVATLAEYSRCELARVHSVRLDDPRQ
jgi:selenocysteine lyase/cysteine desulfurase